METTWLLRLLIHGNTAEFEQALAANGGSEYAVLLQGLAEEQDDKLVFWCLELLLQGHREQLKVDVHKVIPLLVGRLTWESGPVFDRAQRILNGLGEPVLLALLAAIRADPDGMTAVACTAALRGNPNLYLLAEQVMSLLAQQLDSPDESIRLWTLIVLMDIGPLRPWFDSRLPVSAFEALYTKLLTVARQLAANQQEVSDRYVSLLEHHLGKPYRP